MSSHFYSRLCWQKATKKQDGFALPRGRSPPYPPSPKSNNKIFACGANGECGESDELAVTEMGYAKDAEFRTLLELCLYSRSC